MVLVRPDSRGPEDPEQVESTLAVESPDLSVGALLRFRVFRVDEWKRVESGAEGARTPDLRAASAALSQLSYGPEKSVRVYAPPRGVST